MPRLGDTALVLPVPALDGVLASVSARHPHVVRVGIPAHLTVLYPFVPTDQHDATTMRAWAEVLASAGVMQVGFVASEVSPGFVSLYPEPADGVRELIRMVRARWPEITPYGGAYGEDPPAHVTVAMGASETEQEDIVAIVGSQLPIWTSLTEAYLVALTAEGWVTRARRSLGGLGTSAARISES